MTAETATATNKTISRMAKLLDSVFSFFAAHPLLTLAGLVFLCTVFTVDSRALWFSDEVRHGNAFQHLVEANNWLVMHMNGLPYHDKPPLYFWSLWVLYQFFGEITPSLFFTAAALWGYAFLCSTYLLARKVGGLNEKRSLLACLLLLATPFFQMIIHYARMDLMFATFVCLTYTTFYVALQQDGPNKYTILGFFFAGIAVLTKGQFGPSLPILTVAVYLFWTGQPMRMFKWDVILGGILLVGMIMAWLGGAYLVEGPGFIDNIINKQVLGRTFGTWHHKEPFFYYMIAGPLIWLPWTFLLFTAPVRKALTVSYWKERWAKRREVTGMSYLWMAWFSGFVFFSAVSIKVLIYVLPLLAPLAIVTASSLHKLDVLQSRRFWGLVPLWALLMVGVFLVGDKAVQWDIPFEGTYLLAALFALGAYWIWMMRKGTAVQLVTLMLVFTLLYVTPLFGIMAPSLDPAMSTKAPSLMIKEYREKGYTPMTFKVYSGVYTYYSGKNILETYNYPELDAFVLEHPKTIAAMSLNKWKNWKNKPASAKVIDTHWMVDRKQVLVLIDE
ncbi:MAG: ArnT family glycosyltransferase [Desulfovibrio sp.]